MSLHPSGKIIDAYRAPPLFKAYDRTSKEFRRRSVDATLILGGPQDIQDSDPVFVIRRAPQRVASSSHRGSMIGSPRASVLNSPIFEDLVGEDAVAQSSPSQARTLHAGLEPPTLLRSNTDFSTASVDTFVTATDERTDELLARAASPQATRQEIIAAQRAVSRANQRAILSAQKNSEQGVDIVLPDRGTVRSSRLLDGDRVRYSYIDQDGTVDISELVESEWAGSAQGDRSHSSQSRDTLGTDNDSFHSLESPSSSASFSTNTSRGRPSMEEEDDDDDREAISRLADAQVPIEDSQHSREATRSPISPTATSNPDRRSDVLQDAIARPDTLHTESLQDRLDRVLAKVRDGKAIGRNSPNLRSRGAPTGSGRSSPNTAAAPVNATGRTSPSDRRSPSSSGSHGRRSPFTSTGGRDSPSIDQLIGARSPLSSAPGKKLSLNSLSSAGTDQPSTPNSSTPISSVNSNHRSPVAYHPAFGLDTLMALVDGDSHRRVARPKGDPGADALFGHSVELQSETKDLFGSHKSHLDDMDAVRSPLRSSDAFVDLFRCAAA